MFLLTFNAATTSELIGEAGGTVLFEPMVVPTRGVIGMAIDATGGVVGYWQPAVVEGFDVFGEIGGAVWFELNASDFDAAERFYAHAFDWSIVRNDEVPRRAVFERGGRTSRASSTRVGGCGPTRLRRGAWHSGSPMSTRPSSGPSPPGGTLVRAPWDLPTGRRAGLVDPTGAPFLVASDAER